MINLKLFGLPRTGTNAVAWNVEQTWPDLVRIWHEKLPGGGAAWQHGQPRVCEGIDGYLLTMKPSTVWLASMENYYPVDGKTRRDLVRVWGTQNSAGIWRRWRSAAIEFSLRERAIIVDATQSMGDMYLRLVDIALCFDLPPAVSFHVEDAYMQRASDVGARLSEKPYQWPR